MSKIYDIAFRMGVLFNVLLWTILNILSFRAAENEFIRREIEYESAEIKFSGFCCGRFIWGVPFAWDEKYFVVEGAGAILNVIIMVAGGFFFGFLFRFVWSKSHGVVRN